MSEHNCLRLQILTSTAECADLSGLSGLAAAAQLLLYHARLKQ